MIDKRNTAILAYSGGLDSTISIDWIKKNYGFISIFTNLFCKIIQKE